MPHDAVVARELVARLSLSFVSLSILKVTGGPFISNKTSILLICYYVL